MQKWESWSEPSFARRRKKTHVFFLDSATVHGHLCCCLFSEHPGSKARALAGRIDRSGPNSVRAGDARDVMIDYIRGKNAERDVVCAVR